jgi:hypothetical protein
MEHLQNSLDVIAVHIVRISEVFHCRSLYSERPLDPPAPLMILSPKHPDEKEHKGPLSVPPGVLNHGINTNLIAKSLESEFYDTMGEKIIVPSLPR